MGFFIGLIALFFFFFLVHLSILFCTYIQCAYIHSAIKKNEIMPFAATWVDLEIIAPSEVNRTKTDIIWYHSYVEYNFLKWFRYIIYDTEVDLQISKTNLWWLKEKHGVCRGKVGWGAGNKSGAWKEHTHTTMYKTDSQQGPTV